MAAVLAAAAMPWWLAVVIAIAIAVPVALRASPWGLAPLLPLLALLGGGWWALAGWTLAAAALPTWVLGRRQGEAPGGEVEDLRLAEHERAIMQRHVERYPHLMDACLELSQTRDEDHLAATLLAAARILTPGWRGGRVYLGPAGDLRLRANDPPGPASESEVLERLVAYCAQEVRQLVRRIGDEVLLCLPLRGERRSGPGLEAQRRGVLLVRMTSRGAEDVLVIDLLRALGRLGGLGMAAVDLVEQARSLAIHDDLTGLYGRHEFLRRLDESLSAARRSGASVGLIMLDLDHLKRFNDTWGHATGDEALRAVARAIRDCLPAEAAACRYGGEEFGILVPSDLAGRSGLIAETILDAIRHTHVHPERADVGLTASLGWVVIGAEEDAASAMARADEACYRAKAGGRDRVEAG